jgi:hypothetical protein
MEEVFEPLLVNPCAAMMPMAINAKWNNGSLNNFFIKEILVIIMTAFNCQIDRITSH